MNGISNCHAALGGFFDLAKLVSASGTSKSSAYEELAYKIGVPHQCCQVPLGVTIGGIMRLQPSENEFY